MADSITHQPDDIITLIAHHLTAQELIIFKMVCQKFNQIGSAYVFLQPLYNRLYQLDKSLPTLLNPANPVLQFQQAFEKISIRQKEEIVFLKEQHKDYDNFDAQLSKLEENDQTISTLEQQHFLLEDANASIINASIELAKSTHSTRLDLNNIGITRFFIPENRNDFLKKLQVLILDNNLLTIVNVKNFTALESLHCHDNAPSISINMENCIALDTTHFLYESVVDINIKGASQWVQNQFSEMETTLLFKQLAEATNPNAQAQLIERLAERYTMQNCLQHNCVSHIGAIAKTGIISALTSACNTVSNCFYLPSFISSGTSEQENRKRKNEDNDIDDRELKRRKANTP